MHEIYSGTLVYKSNPKPCIEICYETFLTGIEKEFKTNQLSVITVVISMSEVTYSLAIR